MDDFEDLGVKIISEGKKVLQTERVVVYRYRAEK